MKIDRQAFTMVELIFVIVIIAILAAVALPRLAATRTDAELSVKAKNIMIAASEIGAYAVAKAQTEKNMEVMSEAVRKMIKFGHGTQPNLNVPTLNVKAGDVGDCAILKIENQGGNVEILKIEFGSSSDEECSQFRNLIDTSAFPIPLRGSRISF